MARMSDADQLIARARLAQGLTEDEARKNQEFREWSQFLRSTITMNRFVYGSGGLIIGSLFPWLLGN